MNHQKIKDSFMNTWDTFKVLGGECFIHYVEDINDTEVTLREYIILNNFQFTANEYGSCHAYQLLFNNYSHLLLEDISTRYF